MRLDPQAKAGAPGHCTGYTTRICGPSLPFMDGKVTVHHMQQSVQRQGVAIDHRHPRPFPDKPKAR
jgi:hypothetical protein